jgi:Zn-dependent oligopeptidase
MLGYSSYSEMSLKPKMAHNIENVEKLLDGLTHKITNIGRKEH